MRLVRHESVMTWMTRGRNSVEGHSDDLHHLSNAFQRRLNAWKNAQQLNKQEEPIPTVYDLTGQAGHGPHKYSGSKSVETFVNVRTQRIEINFIVSWHSLCCIA